VGGWKNWEEGKKVLTPERGGGVKKLLTAKKGRGQKSLCPFSEPEIPTYARCTGVLSK
jgi:hypothetical protein